MAQDVEFEERSTGLAAALEHARPEDGRGAMDSSPSQLRKATG
jgi:hypothetical protein